MYIVQYFATWQPLYYQLFTHYKYWLEMGVVVNGPQHTGHTRSCNLEFLCGAFSHILRDLLKAKCEWLCKLQNQNWDRQEICINCFPVSQSLEFITHQTLWDISDVIVVK